MGELPARYMSCEVNERSSGAVVCKLNTIAASEKGEAEQSSETRSHLTPLHALPAEIRALRVRIFPEIGIGVEQVLITGRIVQREAGQVKISSLAAHPEDVKRVGQRELEGDGGVVNDFELHRRALAAGDPGAANAGRNRGIGLVLLPPPADRLGGERCAVGLT